MDNLKILKFLGQNFLVEKNIINKVVEAGEIKPDDFILEIGPGRGALTFELAKYAGRVIAIEKDKGLAQKLSDEIKIRGLDNVEIIHGDAMKIFKTAQLKPLKIDLTLGKIFKIVSNPPYEIAARLIIDFLISKNPPTKIVFVIQKEIAQRALARPGDMNILAVITQTFGIPKIDSYIPRQCFSPQPRVDSAILSIETIKNTGISDKESFIHLVKAGFLSKRKFLLNNLADKLGFDKSELREIFTEIGLDEKVRAEELAVERWIELVKSL